MVVNESGNDARIGYSALVQVTGNVKIGHKSPFGRFSLYRKMNQLIVLLIRQDPLDFADSVG